MILLFFYAAGCMKIYLETDFIINYQYASASFPAQAAIHIIQILRGPLSRGESRSRYNSF